MYSAVDIVKAVRVLVVCGIAQASHWTSAGVPFEMNAGQAGPGTSFIWRGRNQTIFLRPGGASLGAGTSTIDMDFVGADPGAKPVGVDPLEARVHYLVGAPENWRTNVRAYSRVEFRDVYPGVDLVYYDDYGRLEYDLVVQPGADASQIRIRFRGAQRIDWETNGGVELDTADGKWRHTNPEIYQLRKSVRRKVAGRLRTLGPDEATFEIGEYDHAYPLVIDPVLVFSSYLGGSVDDTATSMALDGAGNAYIAGWTDSLDFPEAPGPRLGAPAGVDVYVAKIGPDGKLLYITYLGGSGDDRAFGIAVDRSGTPVVAGWTYSPDFPVVNAGQARSGGMRDAFVAKLNAAGSALVFSTYFGGSGADSANAVALDGQGNVYVAGETGSPDFPVRNAVQSVIGGGQDGFAAKFSGTGTLVYATFFGGGADDRATSIAVDSSGYAYITGGTFSSNFPVVQAFQSTLKGQQDAFAAKIGPSGNTLAYSTYLGGSGGLVGAPETGQGIAVDAAGCAYVVGTTSSADFPTVNPLQSSISGSQDAFAVKVAASGTALVYSTYLGGYSFDAATAVAVDGQSRAHIAGYTASTDLPVASPVQGSNAGSYDAFVAKLSPAGNSLEMATYLGGAKSDSGSAVAVDASGNIYLAGQTFSSDFPLVNASQGFQQPAGTAFFGRISRGSAGNGQEIGYVDAAGDGSWNPVILKGGTLYVAGWAADTATGAPVGSVTVYVDGTSVGTAVLGGARPDVAQAYGKSMYTASGWSFQMSTAGLSIGTHTVTAWSAGTSGSVQLSGTKAVTVVAAGQEIGYMDAAGDAGWNPAILKGGTLYAAGWAADTATGAPVGSVTVYVDGTSVGTAVLGGARPDVAQAYGKSMYAASGWSFQMPTAGLSIGVHTVTAWSAGTSGSVQLSGTKVVTVVAAGQEIGYMDAAGDAGWNPAILKGGTLYAAGWAADTATGAPVGSVTVYVDGASVGTAVLGGARPDVAQAYGKSMYAASGWSFQISTAGLSIGAHTVAAWSNGASGTVQLTGTKTVTVLAGGQEIGYVDAAGGANWSPTILKGGMLYVAGWAADTATGAPVDSVTVYVDGASVGTAMLGGARPDVAQAYGKSMYTASGWSFQISTAGLSIGAHTVTAAAAGPSGHAQLAGTKTVTVTAF